MGARAQLQLERCRLRRLNIDFNDAWLSTEATLPEDMRNYLVRTDYTMYEAVDDDQGTDQFLMVDMTVECRPFDEEQLTRFSRVDIEIVGIFRIECDTPQERAEQLKFLNAVAMLHGAARGQIISATGNCVDGPFILPAINYVSDAPEEEDAVSEANTTSREAPNSSATSASELPE